MRSGANDYILKKDLRRLTPALIREIEARGFIRRAESSDKARLLSDARYEVVATAADAIITIDEINSSSFNVGAENIFGYKSRGHRQTERSQPYANASQHVSAFRLRCHAEM
jgi:hypothetical protein